MERISLSSRPARVPAARSTRAVTVNALVAGEKLSDNPDYYRILRNQRGESTALSKLDNGKPLVLAFYPAASTPGCTNEMCSFRDAYRELQAAGATIVGISGDEPAKNAKFAMENNLPFDLLSDSGNFLRKSFGIKGDFLGLLPGRETIVVVKGVVKKTFNSQFGIDEHVKEALDAIKAA